MAKQGVEILGVELIDIDTKNCISLYAFYDKEYSLSNEKHYSSVVKRVIIIL